MDNSAKWWLLLGLWGLYFGFGLGFSGLAPLVQPIREGLDLSATQMGQVLGSWQVIYMLCAIPGALLMLRHGPVTALSFGALIVLASLLLRAMASDFATLLLSVALLGIGGPVISIGCPFLVAQLFTGRAFGFAMGAYATAPVLANMLTFALSEPVLMPALSENWRHVLGLWAALAALPVVFWLFVSRHGPGRAAVQGKVQIPGFDRGFVIAICLVGILIFFVDHGYKSWLPEILRHAGYPVQARAILSTATIGFWLLSLLIVPPLIGNRRDFNLALLGLSGLLIAGSLGLMVLEPGTAHVIACLATGFAIGPLMTLGLMPILARHRLSGATGIVVMACFFTAAEIGGTLGPVALGAVLDAHGEFTPAFLAFAGAALLVPALLIRHGNALDPAKGERRHG